MSNIRSQIEKQITKLIWNHIRFQSKININIFYEVRDKIIDHLIGQIYHNKV
jgi:hypothetical protein